MSGIISEKAQENREIKEELKMKTQQVENLQKIMAEVAE